MMGLERGEDVFQEAEKLMNRHKTYMGKDIEDIIPLLALLVSAVNDLTGEIIDWKQYIELKEEQNK